MGDVLVYIEKKGGAIHRSVLEVLGRGRELADGLGGRLLGVVAGETPDSLLEELAKYRLDRLIQVRGDALAPYNLAAHGDAVELAAKSCSPEVILFSATLTGREVAPRCATLLDGSLAQDNISVEQEGGTLLVKRPMYAGKSYATLRLTKQPYVVSIRPKAYPTPAPDPGDKPAVEQLQYQGSPDPTAKVVELVSDKSGRIGLTEADIIVSGGRGLRGPENFAMLEELADLVGGAVGASRAAVDAGWRPHSDQVGQTGKVVSPQLYIACGISGAVQHLAGMSTSKCIVAINKDPEAPIFSVADYGIVGDLFEVVPALIQALKERNA